MALFLDTDICIDIFRAYLPALRWFSLIDPNESIYLPGYVVMELLYGCRNQGEADKVMRFVSRFRVIWPTIQTSQRVLKHYSKRKLAFHLGIMDAFIAETVKSHQGTLLTFNQKHYQAIDDLLTQSP